MALQTGLNASCMIGEEVTWGLPVTPTIGLPLAADPTLGQQIDMLESKGVIANAAVIKSTQWALGKQTVGGDLGFELYDRSLSVLFKHMFGTTSGGGPFTLTPVAGSLTGKGLTTQIGLPNTLDGTVAPLTYSGCKVASWEVACAAPEIATLGVTLAARQEIGLRTVADSVTNSTATVTSATAAFGPDDLFKPVSGTGIPANSFVGIVNSATSIGLSSSSFANTPVNATTTAASQALTLGLALTAVSYASGMGIGMTFVGGSATIAGTAYKFKKGSIKGDNKLNIDRRFVGQRAIDEPLEADQREFVGMIDSEYFSMTAYRRFLQGTEAAVVFNLAAGSSTVAITMNARFNGDTPKRNGTDVVMESLPFKCVAPTTDASAITAVVSAA
jgi:hypothetical protein